MHMVNVAIILSIGNCVAWIAALYMKDAERGLIGHVIVAYSNALTIQFINSRR